MLVLFKDWWHLLVSLFKLFKNLGKNGYCFNPLKLFIASWYNLYGDKILAQQACVFIEINLKDMIRKSINLEMFFLGVAILKLRS